MRPYNVQQRLAPPLQRIVQLVEELLLVALLVGDAKEDAIAAAGSQELLGFVDMANERRFLRGDIAHFLVYEASQFPEELEAKLGEFSVLIAIDHNSRAVTAVGALKGSGCGVGDRWAGLRPLRASKASNQRSGRHLHVGRVPRATTAVEHHASTRRCRQA